MCIILQLFAQRKGVARHLEREENVRESKQKCTDDQYSCCTSRRLDLAQSVPKLLCGWGGHVVRGGIAGSTRSTLQARACSGGGRVLEH
jgi:hypothetical protein